MLLPLMPAVAYAQGVVFYIGWTALLPASTLTGSVDNSSLPTLHTIQAILQINNNT